MNVYRLLYICTYFAYYADCRRDQIEQITFISMQYSIKLFYSRTPAAQITKQ